MKILMSEKTAFRGQVNRSEKGELVKTELDVAKVVGMFLSNIIKNRVFPERF